MTKEEFDIQLALGTITLDDIEALALKSTNVDFLVLMYVTTAKLWHKFDGDKKKFSNYYVGLMHTRNAIINHAVSIGFTDFKDRLPGIPDKGLRNRAED